MSPFGVRLLQGMQNSKTDRKSLAAALGISPQAVGQAIKEGKFSAANTAKAARYLGVNWYWLATGDETMAVSDVAGLTAQERAVLARLVDAAPAALAKTRTRQPEDQRRGGLRLTPAQADRRRDAQAVEIERRHNDRREADKKA